MEKQIFYHQLRLIFTYYSSQGHKQAPLILREKNLQKFLTQSTLIQLLINQQKPLNLSPTKSSRVKDQNSKFIKVFINSFSKPIGFEDFVKLLTKLISHSQNNKNNKNNNGHQQLQEEQDRNQDLFELCHKDKFLSQIFSFLYEQIEHNTQFGRVVLFSQEKEHFSQQVFETVNKNLQLLKIIYFHYFPKAQKHEVNSLQKILNVLKTVFHQFEIVPLRLSLTEVLVILLQVIESKSKSVYEQQFEKLLHKQEQVEQKQWSQFTLLQFMKVVIIVGNLLALKDTENSKFQFKGENMIDFLQLISISKGYKVIKSTYKLNQSFFKISKQKDHQRQRVVNKDISHFQNPVIRFDIKRLEQNTNNKSTTILLNKLKKLLQLIFKAYSIDRDSNQIISKKSFEFFCKQFKLIPNLISKQQMQQIYMRIFMERQFYQSFQKNHENPPRQQQLIIQEKQKLRQQQLIIEEKQKLLNLIQTPQYGLRYEQFQRVLIYASQTTSSICKKFTTNERLIFYLQHTFSQPKFKQILSKQINQNRITTNLIDGQNPKMLMKKYIDEKEMLLNFEKEHKSMYLKLKRTYQ